MDELLKEITIDENLDLFTFECPRCQQVQGAHIDYLIVNSIINCEYCYSPLEIIYMFDQYANWAIKPWEPV